MGPQHYPSDEEPVTRQQSTYLTDSEAASFCAVFGDGLDSGMSYARIIDMLERQGYNRKVTDGLRTAILEDGNRLGDALLRNGLLDATARKLIIVAEKQGTLPTTFKELGHLYSQRHSRRKRFVSSLVEPCLLIAIGLILARNVVGGDLEAIAQSTDVGESLKPLFIQSGIEIGIFASIAVFLGLGFLHLPVEMKLRNLAARLWLTFPIPMINKAARLHSLSSFFHYTQQSISSGLTVHQALELAAEASNNPNIERKIGVARQHIEAGNMLAASLRHAKAVPDEAIDFIDVGEEAGRLEERLDELASRYKEEADETFDRTLRAFVYLLRLLVVVMVIGGLMLSVSDIFSGGIGP